MLSAVDMYIVLLLLIKYLCERFLRSVPTSDRSGHSILRIRLHYWPFWTEYTKDPSPLLTVLDTVLFRICPHYWSFWRKYL